MERLLKKGGFFIILLFLAIPFSAQATQLNLTVTGFGSPPLRDIYNGNYYTMSPYYATIDGHPNVPIWCIDWDHNANAGNTWTAYVTPLPSAPNSYTYLNSLVSYEKMAWLFDQYPSQTDADKKAIQWLVWDIAHGSNTHPGYTPTGYNYWDTQVNAHYADPGNNYSRWLIFSDVNKTYQEFMVGSVNFIV
jgi:hypothetical protein